MFRQQMLHRLFDVFFTNTRRDHSHDLKTTFLGILGRLFINF